MVKQNDWSVFQRQPASAIWLGLIKAFGKVVKSILPIALVVLFSSRRQDESPLELLLIVIPLLVFGLSVIDHFYFRFSITGNQLVVKKGLLARKTIILPIKKIQAVNVEQSWLHRLLELAQISFDSPGSEEAEVKINLNKEQAFSLKTFILGYSITEHHPVGEVKSEIVRLSFADLIRLGISANHLETLAILSGLIISFFNNIKQIIEDRFSQLYEESAADLMSDGIMLIYISIALLFASVVVSFVRIVLKFADFALSKTDTGFSLRSGLINRTEYIIPFRKIQYITWRTSWLRKRLPVYLLEYHSIGDPARNKNLKVKIPVTSVSLLNRLISMYYPGDTSKSGSSKISRTYVYRTTLTWGILPFLIVGGIVTSFFHEKALFLLILPAYVFISAWLFYKKFRFNYTSEIIRLHRGIFGESEAIIQWKNIQSVRILQSLFQQRQELATLKIFTAGGALTIPFIPLLQAQQIQNYALYQIESMDTSWM